MVDWISTVRARKHASSVSVIGWRASKSRTEWRAGRSCAGGGTAAAEGSSRRTALRPGPAGPRRGRLRNGAGVGIGPAGRIGVPPLGAAGVKQQIMEIPDQEAVVAFVGAQARVADGAGLEQHLAVDEQCEKLDPGKA